MGLIKNILATKHLFYKCQPRKRHWQTTTTTAFQFKMWSTVTMVTCSSLLFQLFIFSFSRWSMVHLLSSTQRHHCHGNLDKTNCCVPSRGCCDSVSVLVVPNSPLFSSTPLSYAPYAAASAAVGTGGVLHEDKGRSVQKLIITEEVQEKHMFCSKSFSSG